MKWTILVLPFAFAFAALAACDRGRDAAASMPEETATASASPSTQIAPSSNPPAVEARPPSAPPAEAASGEPVRYFYFGNHVPRTKIDAIEGRDTARAVLRGVTTAADNHAYCVESVGDPARAATICAGQRKARSERMTADCIARTVSDGGAARWVRDEPTPDGKIRPVWRDVASGEIRDYSGAGGGYVLTAAFRLMCPAASTAITTQD